MVVGEVLFLFDDDFDSEDSEENGEVLEIGLLFSLDKDFKF